MKVTEECFRKVKKDCFKFIKSQETSKEKFGGIPSIIPWPLLIVRMDLLNKYQEYHEANT